ncbi:MAG: cyclic nucleotide-binding domain-containing protein [Acidobacteriota bacterium]
MDIFDRLREFEILSHLDGECLDLLADCTSLVHYAEGSSILKEGDQTADFYLIDKGCIEIRRTTPYGSYSLAELEAGDVFGETSFLDQKARSGDAVAKRDSVLFAVSDQRLRKMLESNQRFTLSIYWALWKSLSVKLRKTNENLAQFFGKEGTPAAAETKASSAQGQVKVGIQQKRDLFREQTLSPMEINFLATLSKERRFDADEYIFRDGEEGEHLFVVLEGKVMIAKDVAGAGEEALAFLGRGDYFGEMALIDNKPRSATAKAHTEGAMVLMIPREVLEGILDIQKVSSLRLLKILCNLIAKRLREIDDKLVGWYIFDAGSGQSLGLPT